MLKRTPIEHTQHKQETLKQYNSMAQKITLVAAYGMGSLQKYSSIAWKGNAIKLFL
jgi:hypothetical protein